MRHRLQWFIHLRAHGTGSSHRRLREVVLWRCLINSSSFDACARMLPKIKRNCTPTGTVMVSTAASPPPHRSFYRIRPVAPVCFLGPTQIFVPNDVSIRLSVLQRSLTGVPNKQTHKPRCITTSVAISRNACYACDAG